MIKLYQFASGYGLPNFSPFCMKLETYLRMADLDYEVVNIGKTNKAPKGKLPFINVDGKIVSDSEHVIEYVNQKYQIDLDRELTTEQKAISSAFQAMLDEKLYWVIVYSRWVDEHSWPKVKKFSGQCPQGLSRLRLLLPNIW